MKYQYAHSNQAFICSQVENEWIILKLHFIVTNIKLVQILQPSTALRQNKQCYIFPRFLNSLQQLSVTFGQMINFAENELYPLEL